MHSIAPCHIYDKCMCVSVCVHVCIIYYDDKKVILKLFIIATVFMGIFILYILPNTYIKMRASSISATRRQTTGCCMSHSCSIHCNDYPLCASARVQSRGKEASKRHSENERQRAECVCVDDTGKQSFYTTYIIVLLCRLRYYRIKTTEKFH